MHKLNAYLPAILWAVTVLGIGSLHHIPQPPIHGPIDKVGHFGMYGLLGVLTARGWVSNEARSHLLLPVLLAMSVGAIDEIHQRYVPGRSSEFADFAADVAGVSVGFSLVARRRSMHNNGME